MNYPLVSEYVSSIKLAGDNLEQLSHLKPVLEDDGNPVFSSGNFAVVFKMWSERENKFYALKCFIKDQSGRDESYHLIADELRYISRDFIVPIKYFDKELFVDSSSCADAEFPVLLMDWVEGITLDKFVRQHLHDQYALQMLTYQFCRMASWMMTQPFAHGDLKPDNILVKKDGSLMLVDYDGMFVPAMKGQKAREIGSPDFRHPTRSIDHFDEHVDDFSFASIAMQLCAIALDPSLLTNRHGDKLLLNEADHRDLPNSDMHAHLRSLLNNHDFEQLYALYHLAHAQQTLRAVSYQVFQVPKPMIMPEAVKQTLSIMSPLPESVRRSYTKVTDEDLASSVMDDYGVLYSHDGSRLLKGCDLSSYSIRSGTQIVCDYAFNNCASLNSLILPESVTNIGDWAFGNCILLNSVSIPDSVTSIGDFAFSGSLNLSSVCIPANVKHIGKNPFAGSEVAEIISKSPLFVVENFSLYDKDKTIIIAFLNKHISDFSLPNTVEIIGDEAFDCCLNLVSVHLPNSVTRIGNNAFFCCQSLTSINVPSSVTCVGDGAFSHCYALRSIHLPESIVEIGNEVFRDCMNLASIDIPGSVISIGRNPFLECSALHITCKSPFFETDGDALYSLGKIRLIAFLNHGLFHFRIPETVSIIEPESFWGCYNLVSIYIPNSVTSIACDAIECCDRLTSIFIPIGARSKFEKLLPKSLHIKLKEQ